MGDHRQAKAMSRVLFDAMVNTVENDGVADVAGLLDAAQDVNAQYNRDETALSYACASNGLAFARLLMERGADINTVSTGGGS